MTDLSISLAGNLMVSDASNGREKGLLVVQSNSDIGVDGWDQLRYVTAREGGDTPHEARKISG